MASATLPEEAAVPTIRAMNDRWVIEAEDLQLSETSFTVLSYREARQMFDRNFILNALKQAKGNISLAAKVTGLTRPTLYDMMKKNGITVQMEAKMDGAGET